MVRSFHHVVPFEVVEIYIVGLGYKFEPIYKSGSLQYYAIGANQVGVAPEKTAKNQVTGDMLTHIYVNIFIKYQFYHQIGRHDYDAESFILYRKLYQRFQK